MTTNLQRNKKRGNFNQKKASFVKRKPFFDVFLINTITLPFNSFLENRKRGGVPILTPSINLNENFK